MSEPTSTPERVASYPEWVTTGSEQRLYDDFRVFVWLLWTHLRLPKPTRRQLKISHYLQHGPNRRMIFAFRGVGKSWLTAAYVLWRLYRNPEERIMVVSANEDRAIEFAKFCRRLIDEVPQLAFLRPKPGQRDSVLAFDVGPSGASQSPSVRAVGITGQLTGGRATLLISDDVEVPKNSYTEAMREKLAELVKEYDAVLVPGGEIVYLGTPQTEQSVYLKLRSRGYDCRIWPVRYPAQADQHKYGGALAEDIIEDLQEDPSLVGKSTEPLRFSDADLEARELSYGRSGFALQFMLDTSLSDADRYPLKLADLIVFDCDREVAPVRLTWASSPQQVVSELPNVGFAGDRFHRPMYVSPELVNYEQTVMVIDPSGRGADETAYIVARQLRGMIYLVAVGGFKTGYDDATLRALADIAADYRVQKILVESNFGDGMFVKLFEPVLLARYRCSVEEYRATGQKERRIIADLEPVLNQHRLVVDTRVIKDDLKAEPKHSLMYQLTHLTADRGSLRHDDRLDALAQACRFFREELARNTEKVEDAHRQALREKALQEFMRNARRGQPAPTYATVASILSRR